MGKARGEVNDFGKATADADKPSKGFFGGLKDAGSGLLGMVNPVSLVTTGVFALCGALVAGVKAASDEAVGIERMNTTLKNSIPGWDGNTSAVEAYISKQEKLAFQDDKLRDSLGYLVGQTKDLKEAQELQSVAMDLARAKNIDLMDASKLVGKVDAGNIGTLKKLGFQVTDQMSKEEALAAIRQQTAGQAEAYANTAAGSMDRLMGVFGNALEDIGGTVLPGITAALGGVADFLSSDAFQSGLQSAISLLGNGLSGAFQIVGNVISFLLPIIQPFADAFIGFFTSISSGGDLVASLGNMFSNLGPAISNAWGVVGPALGGLLGGIIQWIVDNGPSIAATIVSWGVGLWQWIVDVAPTVFAALGTFIGSIWQWITDNGPSILATLVSWGTAFWQWIVDAMPTVFATLGNLIGAVWQWITDNGPGILSTLGVWTGAFLNWIMSDLLPQVPGWLLNVATAVWNFITQNGPTILAKLLEWTGAFMGWVFNDLLPQVPGWLANVAGALWTFVTENGPIFLTKLGEWTTAFFNWVMNDILPQVPGWLGNIAGALWTWITSTAADLGSKLINEWIPSMWNWLTGPGGILETLPYKLNDIWTGITTWIGQTATDIVTAAVGIGEGLYNGIIDGISGLGQALWDFISGVAQSVWDSIVGFFTGGGDGGGGTQQDPPHKAIGGSVWSGKSYLVGENGPEMFTPWGPGSIASNHNTPSGYAAAPSYQAVTNVIIDGVRVPTRIQSQNLRANAKMTLPRSRG